MSMSAKVLARFDESKHVITVERRRDVRHKATYRPCCVIAAGKVTMGLIRNYSVGGAHIEVDADLSVGDNIRYFWEANTCITAKVVWSDGKAHGVEHVEDIRKPTESFPARSVRVPCQADATCWINGEVQTALVENISLGGMRVRGLPPVTPGTLLSVVFCGIELQSVSVRWVKDGRMGLHFQERLTREMLAQLLLDDQFGLKTIEFAKL